MSSPLDAVGLGTIGVGLGADAAVASFESGHLQDAISLLRDALLSLARYEPDSNLQATHCHFTIRQAILWLRQRVLGLDAKLTNRLISMSPGVCSNPNPVPEIEQHPMRHIDFAWYTLAEIEITSGLDVGVRAIVRRFGTQGYLPNSEHVFRIQTLSAAISRLNPIDFSDHILRFLSSAAHLALNQDEYVNPLDIVSPERVHIPDLAQDGSLEPVTIFSARHAFLAYRILAIFNENRAAYRELGNTLVHELGDSHPVVQCFRTLNSDRSGDGSSEYELTLFLARLENKEQLNPWLVFEAGLRIGSWISSSQFKALIGPHLRSWLKTHWTRIFENQRFQLHSPRTSVPAIQQMLNDKVDGETYAAKLTLVASDAVGFPLSKDMRQSLQSVIDRDEAH